MMNRKENGMEQELNKLVELAQQLIEQANKIRDMKKGFVYTNICKNCGKEIKVARKNIRFCDDKCKKEYLKKRRHEYYKSMSTEDKEKQSKEAVIRMRELRAKRKELKYGNKGI